MGGLRNGGMTVGLQANWLRQSGGIPRTEEFQSNCSHTCRVAPLEPMKIEWARAFPPLLRKNGAPSFRAEAEFSGLIAPVRSG